MWWFHTKNEKRVNRTIGVREPCKVESVVQPRELEKTPGLQDVPPNQEKYATAFEKHAKRFDDAFERAQDESSNLARRRRQYSLMLDASARCMRCLYNIRMWMHNDLAKEERMHTFELICDDYFARCIRHAYGLAYTPADETLIPRRWNRRWSDPSPRIP